MKASLATLRNASIQRIHDYENDWIDLTMSVSLRERERRELLVKLRALDAKLNRERKRKNDARHKASKLRQTFLKAWGRHAPQLNRDVVLEAAKRALDAAGARGVPVSPPAERHLVPRKGYEAASAAGEQNK